MENIALHWEHGLSKCLEGSGETSIEESTVHEESKIEEVIEEG